MDDVFFCYTLEGLKVMIAAGVYSVEMTESPHFHRPMPLIDGVKGRSAVRLHPGHDIADTEGCILVGNHSNGTTLGDSRAASDSLNEKILVAIVHQERVAIEVRDAA